MKTITELRSEIEHLKDKIDTNQNDYARSGRWGYLNLADQDRERLDSLKLELHRVYTKGGL